MRKTANKEPVCRKTLGFMIKTAWQKKPSLFLLYFIRLICEFVQKMQVVILPKFLIDELMLIIGGAELSVHINNIILYAALIVITSFVTQVTLHICFHVKSVINEWFNRYFEEDIAGRCMNMDFEHTENPEALDRLNKAKEGMSWYSGGVVGILDSLYDIIINVTVLLGVSFVIIITCPLLFPVQLISLVLITWLNGRNNRLEVESFKALAKSNRVFGYVFYQLSDFSLGKEIRLYDSTDMMCKKAKYFSDEQINVWHDRAEKQNKNDWAMNIINALRDGLSYFYIGYLAITGAISIGDFSMSVAAASSLYWGLYGVVSGVQNIIKRCNYAYEYLRFTAYPNAMSKGDKKVSGNSHTIEFKNVSFKYPRSDKYVLRNINISIKQGEHLSVVGLNGAGKTTFIKLLCRLYDVTDGEILIDGINIKEYSDEEYRKLFAVVFQDFKLFAFSLRENIALNAPADDEKIENVLKLSGFYDDAQKLENGLDTMLFKSFDEKGTELSGGQQQKTAISRALYKDAPIVILDEPTAALDPIAEYDIYRSFDSLVGGKTAIYISHRLSSCKFCDKIAVFADDTIKEYGTHDELVGLKNGIYSEMFATQAQYYNRSSQDIAHGFPANSHDNCVNIS